MFKPNKTSGFTLVELSIVLFLIATLLAFGIPAYKAAGLDKEKAITLQNHALMFKQVHDAMGNWAASTYVDIADDSFGNILASDLKTDGYLPAAFGAQYINGVTQDLMGADFRVYYSKSLIEFNGREAQTLRVFATVDSPLGFQEFPDNYLAERYSSPTSQSEFESFVTFWYTELSRIASEKGLVVGIIRKDSNLVVGVNKSFRFNLDSILFPITERPYNRLIVFWGWPDLNGNAGGVNDPDDDSDNAALYAACSITGRVYLRTAQQSDQCLSSGNKSLFSMYSDLPSAPSPFTFVPGFGMVYSYVSKQAITDLSSLGLNCSAVAREYCTRAEGNPYDYQNCGTLNNNHYNLLVDACQSTPVFSVMNNAVVGGGVYQSNELYREGLYEFGRIGGINYEVNAGGELEYHIQYTMCCPPDTPDLE